MSNKKHFQRYVRNYFWYMLLYKVSVVLKDDNLYILTVIENIIE